MSVSAGADRVRLELRGPTAWIVLDAAERHNSLEAADVEAFRAHLERVDATESVRVLVVTGKGAETFCAGASLRQMESGEMSGERFETLTDRLAAVRVPTICALNGSVYGGGAEVALCCDFRIGVTGSRLVVPVAKLGLCYPVGGMQRYVRRLGFTVAQRLLLSGEEMGADEMLRVGYLTALVERDALQDTAEGLARRIADQAPLATTAMKRILGEISAGSLDIERARSLIAEVAASADAREGIAAKRGKRQPEFEGR